MNANYSAGNNLLSGGDGNDSLIASFALTSNAPPFDNFDDPEDFLNSSGNNTLEGGAGDDTLNANIFNWQ